MSVDGSSRSSRCRWRVLLLTLIIGLLLSCQEQGLLLLCRQELLKLLLRLLVLANSTSTYATSSLSGNCLVQGHLRVTARRSSHYGCHFWFTRLVRSQISVMTLD